MSNKEATLARYTPGVPPASAEDLPVYMQSSLSSIASMVNSPTKNFSPLNKEPEKPRVGDLAYANGEAWDPGFGAGLYMYTEEGWVLVSGAGGGGGATPIGGIIMWRGSTAPEHWAICNGSNAPNGMSTPNLTNRFVLGFGTNGIDVTGGSTVTGWTSLTPEQIPSHNHTIAHTHNITSHSHTMEHTHAVSIDTDEDGDHDHSLGQDGDHSHGSYVPGSDEWSIGGTGANRRFAKENIQMPNAGSHSHLVSTDGNHLHRVNGDTGASSSSTTGLTGGTTGGSLSSNSGSTGSGEAHRHSNEPPFYALAYIMRYE